MMKNHYEILGLESDASVDDIKRAYRKLSIKFHPDKNDGDLYFASMFRQVNEAYQVLSDPAKRNTYDNQRSAGDQRSREQQERLAQKERELKEREERLRDTKIRSQAILDEAEKLIYRKPDTSDYSTDETNSNQLNKVIGIKYSLWAVIIILIVLIATKQKPTVDNSITGSTPDKVYHKPKRRHKHKQRSQSEQIVSDSTIKNLSMHDSVTTTPSTGKDTIK